MFSDKSTQMIELFPEPAKVCLINHGPELVSRTENKNYQRWNINGVLILLLNLDKPELVRY
jgi:hypothetical protein